MLNKVLIIVNPVAGKAQGEAYAEALEKVLQETYQAITKIKQTKEANDATKWASESVNEGYETVFCLGGDGTVNEVIKGLMLINETERPFFSFIPMGTVNDLARAIGIPLNPERAIESFRNVSETSIDVGKINDEYFINVIAIGIIPEEVMNTNAEDKNRLGIFAYIKDGIQAFFSRKGYRLLLKSDEEEEQILETNLVLIALTNSVGGIDFMFNQATYNDGLLHFAAVDGHHPISTFNAALELSFDNLLANDLENMIVLQSKALTLKSLDDEEVSTNMDGDPGPNLPISVEVLHKALRVIIPQI